MHMHEREGASVNHVGNPRYELLLHTHTHTHTHTVHMILIVHMCQNCFRHTDTPHIYTIHMYRNGLPSMCCLSSLLSSLKRMNAASSVSHALFRSIERLPLVDLRLSIDENEIDPGCVLGTLCRASSGMNGLRSPSLSMIEMLGLFALNALMGLLCGVYASQSGENVTLCLSCERLDSKDAKQARRAFIFMGQFMAHNTWVLDTHACSCTISRCCHGVVNKPKPPCFWSGLLSVCPKPQQKTPPGPRPE